MATAVDALDGHRGAAAQEHGRQQQDQLQAKENGAGPFGAKAGVGQFGFQLADICCASWVAAVWPGRGWPFPAPWSSDRRVSEWPSIFPPGDAVDFSTPPVAPWRGWLLTVRPSNHHVSAENMPNRASGSNCSKLSGMTARTTASYTLILTILRITSAPTTCMKMAMHSIFLPIGSVNSNETYLGLSW